MSACHCLGLRWFRLRSLKLAAFVAFNTPLVLPAAAVLSSVCCLVWFHSLIPNSLAPIDRTAMMRHTPNNPPLEAWGLGGGGAGGAPMGAAALDDLFGPEHGMLAEGRARTRDLNTTRRTLTGVGSRPTPFLPERAKLLRDWQWSNDNPALPTAYAF